MEPRRDFSTKNYDSSFIYTKANYDKKLFDTIMTCSRIDKHDKSFEVIIAEVKRRQVSPVLLDVLMKNSVVLMMNPKPIPSAFSVFMAKDMKEDPTKLKVFIDMTGVVTYKEGFYYVTNINALIAFLLNAMTTIIYYVEPKRIISDMNLTISATNCFVSMFCYILDYLRVGGFAERRDKIYYMTAMYYQVSVLKKPIASSTQNVAMKVAKYTPQEAHNADFLYDEEDFLNLDTYVKKLVELYHFKGLTTDVILEKWLYLFGNGTQFGLELYPAFSAMLTNAFCGSYLNQQKQIEKCLGRNMLASYCNELLAIGKDSFRA